MSRVSSFIAAGALAASSPVASSEIKKEVPEIAIGANIEKNLYIAGQCAYEQQQSSEKKESNTASRSMIEAFCEGWCKGIKEAWNESESSAVEKQEPQEEVIEKQEPQEEVIEKPLVSGEELGMTLPKPVDGKLDLSSLGRRLVADALDQLAQYPNITVLDLSGVRVNDEMMIKIVHYCPNIESLVLSHASIRDLSENGYICIESLRMLTSVDLERCSINLNKTMDAFSKCPQIKSLGLSGIDLSDFQVREHIKKFPHLERLDLSYNFNIGLDGLKYLSHSQSYFLKELNLSYTNVLRSNYKFESDLKELSYRLHSFHQLECLNLQGIKGSTNLFPLLVDHPTLKAIAIDGKSLNASCIKYLACLKNLESIDFDGLLCSVQDLEPLRDLPNLKSLKGFKGLKGILVGAFGWDTSSAVTKKDVASLIEWFPQVELDLSDVAMDSGARTLWEEFLSRNISK